VVPRKKKGGGTNYPLSHTCQNEILKFISREN